MNETEEHILCRYCEEYAFTYFFGEELCAAHFVIKSKNPTSSMTEG